MQETIKLKFEFTRDAIHFVSQTQNTEMCDQICILDFKDGGFCGGISRDLLDPMKQLVTSLFASMENSIMAAGGKDGHILYDVFIRAEWSLGGEILVSIYF